MSACGDAGPLGGALRTLALAVTLQGAGGRAAPRFSRSSSSLEISRERLYIHVPSPFCEKFVSQAECLAVSAAFGGFGESEEDKAEDQRGLSQSLPVRRQPRTKASFLVPADAA